MFVVRVLAVAVALSVVRVASADQVAPSRSPDAFTDRPLAIVGIMGIATPVGVAGLALEATPARWLTVGAGGGASKSGPQIAIMPRVRFYTGANHGWSIGAGVSGGKYSPCSAWCSANESSGADGDPFASPWTWWGNLDIGFEGRSDKYQGLTYRFFAGVSRAFEVCPSENYPEGCGSRRSIRILPIAGVSIGSTL